MSSYSIASQSRTRPPSHIFPLFNSTLSYTLVRDFAYPDNHPYHYGPPADSSAAQSGVSTPASEKRRLSDPSIATWEKPQWSGGLWGGEGSFPGQQLPQMAFGDTSTDHGPPYSEDEDLHSPVVMSSRTKKHKFTAARPGGYGSAKGRILEQVDGVDNEDAYEADRGYFTGTNGDGSETYYHGDMDDSANGPGGELVTYPPDQARHSLLHPNTYAAPGQRDSHFAATLPSRSYMQEDYDHTGQLDQNDDSRYSRDYQFTIASPDEEMHGKAVALFDFARENENELPLIEGQVIWVSYRHGQGWLVAEDPKTGESGLVPEEYVRLLRDIEGGWTSLNGEVGNGSAQSTSDTNTPPVQTDIESSHAPHTSNGSNGAEKRPPIVSTFSTSSKDLDPYPHHLLGTQAGQMPPQVVHYSGGSQNNTPTLTSPPTADDFQRGLNEVRASGKEKRDARDARETATDDAAGVAR